MNKMLVVVMDVSGSMDGMKIESAKKGATKFIRDNISSGDYLGLIKFSDSAEVVVPLQEISSSADLERYIQAINSLEIEGNTALWDALGMAVDLIVNSLPGALKNYELLVLGVTDGDDNSSERFTSGPSGADEVIRYGKSKGVDIKFLFIAIGSGVSVSTLGKMGKVISVDENPESIVGGFEKAGDVMGSIPPVSSSRVPSPPVPEEKGCPCSRMSFEGEITRHQIDYMERIANQACEFINNYFSLSAGTTVVPVYMLTDGMFDKMFEPESCSQLCLSLQGILADYLGAYNLDSWREDQNPEKRLRIVCCGEPVVKDLLDNEFCRVKESIKHAHAPSPSIYVRRSLSQIMLKYAMAYGAVKSLIYYSTTRRIVNVDDEILTFIASAIALISMPKRDLEELKQRGDPGGTWSLPLWIVRILGVSGLIETLDSMQIDAILDANMDINTFRETLGEIIDDKLRRYR